MQNKSSNITWDTGLVPLKARENRTGHKAGVLWFTGLSASGKSTITRKLEQKLFARGCQTMRLDGDNLRHGLNRDLGFDQASREENVRRFAEVAAVGVRHGSLVTCSLISPYAKDREQARRIIGPDRFLEIFVSIPVEACIVRDPKGLYVKAVAGEIPEFTGISAPYEEPESPDLILETGPYTVSHCVNQVVKMLETLEWV